MKFKFLLKDLKKTERFLIPFLIGILYANDEFSIGSTYLLSYSWENYENIFTSQGYKKTQHSLLQERSLDSLAESYENQIGSIAWCEVYAGDRIKQKKMKMRSIFSI